VGDEWAAAREEMEDPIRRTIRIRKAAIIAEMKNVLNTGFPYVVSYLA